MTTDPQKPFRELIQIAKDIVEESDERHIASAVNGETDAYCTVITEEQRAIIRAAEAALPALAGGDDKLELGRVYGDIGLFANKHFGISDNLATKETFAAMEKRLDDIKQVGAMLVRYAEECFPEINEAGQKHFARLIMESGAQVIFHGDIDDTKPASP